MSIHGRRCALPAVMQYGNTQHCTAAVCVQHGYKQLLTSTVHCHYCTYNDHPTTVPSTTRFSQLPSMLPPAAYGMSAIAFHSSAAVRPISEDGSDSDAGPRTEGEERHRLLTSQRQLPTASDCSSTVASPLTLKFFLLEQAALSSYQNGGVSKMQNEIIVQQYNYGCCDCCRLC